MHYHNTGSQSCPCDLLLLSTTSFTETDDFCVIQFRNCWFTFFFFGGMEVREEGGQTGRMTTLPALIDAVVIIGICCLFVCKLLLLSSDPYDTSSGSLQLISIKPVTAQTNCSHPAFSDRSQDSAIVNGEVIYTHICTLRDVGFYWARTSLGDTVLQNSASYRFLFFCRTWMV